MEPLVAAICYRRKYSAVISDRERRTNIHGALRSRGFFWRFGLIKKMHRSFVAIIGDEIRRFFETKPAQRAARIHIPLPGAFSGCLLSLSAMT
jgi:hypothetical protein